MLSFGEVNRWFYDRKLHFKPQLPSHYKTEFGTIKLTILPPQITNLNTVIP